MDKKFFFRPLIFYLAFEDMVVLFVEKLSSRKNVCKGEAKGKNSFYRAPLRTKHGTRHFLCILLSNLHGNLSGRDYYPHFTKEKLQRVHDLPVELNGVSPAAGGR